MGTIVSQKVYGKNARKAVDEVERRIREIEGLMTIDAPGGDINELNNNAGKEKYNKLNRDVIYVLQKAKAFSGLSGGAFDVTVGPVVKAWGISTKNPRIPPENEINNLLGLINYKDILFSSNGEVSVKLAKPGQIVDLGGIAKGYAGDEAVKIYKNNGIKSAFINLGGNVVVVGSKPDGTPWKIGIQNPRGKSGGYIGVVTASDKAVVTSGDYERYFEKDGVRYHHIIDPKTGYPAESGLISVTIVAGMSIDADALSTAVFVLGLDKGMRLVESIKAVDAVFIAKDKKVYITKGLKGSFLFYDESREYEYAENR